MASRQASKRGHSALGVPLSGPVSPAGKKEPVGGGVTRAAVEGVVRFRHEALELPFLPASSRR